MTSSNVVVPQKGKYLIKLNILTSPFAGLAIYSMIFPIMIIDAWTQMYQLVYFGLRGIPMIRRKDYMMMDRFQLAGLNLPQKVNCWYCEYANGVIAWVKAVANQTEIYSCAIKHSVQPMGHEHHEDFYSYDQFADVNTMEEEDSDHLVK
jgi:hypothetical protein